jgi:hypothetical protein
MSNACGVHSVFLARWRALCSFARAKKGTTRAYPGAGRVSERQLWRPDPGQCTAVIPQRPFCFSRVHRGTRLISGRVLVPSAGRALPLPRAAETGALGWAPGVLLARIHSWYPSRRPFEVVNVHNERIHLFNRTSGVLQYLLVESQRIVASNAVSFEKHQRRSCWATTRYDKFSYNC